MRNSGTPQEINLKDDPESTRRLTDASISGPSLVFVDIN
jgi:hypothetical protein